MVQDLCAVQVGATNQPHANLVRGSGPNMVNVYFFRTQPLASSRGYRVWQQLVRRCGGGGSQNVVPKIHVWICCLTWGNRAYKFQRDPDALKSICMLVSWKDSPMYSSVRGFDLISGYKHAATFWGADV